MNIPVTAFITKRPRTNHRLSSNRSDIAEDLLLPFMVDGCTPATSDLATTSGSEAFSPRPRVTRTRGPFVGNALPLFYHAPGNGAPEARGFAFRRGSLCHDREPTCRSYPPDLAAAREGGRGGGATPRKPRSGRASDPSPCRGRSWPAARHSGSRRLKPVGIHGTLSTLSFAGEHLEKTPLACSRPVVERRENLQGSAPHRGAWYAAQMGSMKSKYRARFCILRRR
jgi:hypothetical protein